MSTTTTPIAAGTPTGPEFVSTKNLRVMFDIAESTAYELKDKGEIDSVCMREKGKASGKRLWVVQSVRDYLDGKREPHPDTIRLEHIMLTYGLTREAIDAEMVETDTAGRRK